MDGNPFGITQVDIPGLIGMNQSLKHQRLEDLYRTQQIATEQRKLDRQDKIDAIRMKVFTKPTEGGDPASGGGGVQPSAPPASPVIPTIAPASEDEATAIVTNAAHTNTISASDAARVRASLGQNGSGAFDKWIQDHKIAVGDAAPVDNHPALQPGPLPPRTDGMVIDQDALNQLVAMEPESGNAIRKMIYDHDKQGLEAAKERGSAMAVAAQAISEKPPQERAAELRNWSSYLIDRGYTPQMIQQAQGDLSDGALARFYRQGKTIEMTISQANADRTFKASQEEKARDNARADAGMSLRERALKVAEGRATAKPSASDASTSDLLRAAGL